MTDPITETIIGISFKVHNVLGFGYYEKLYEAALEVELRRANLSYRRQAPVRVLYEGEVLGHYYCDLIVQDKVIVEVKSALDLPKFYDVQMVNYLTSTGIDTGLIINFGPKQVDIRRKVRVFTAKT